MPKVQFLTQNGPGPRMGMGHYERLLFQHLLLEAPSQEWQFSLLCDGRVGAEAIRADAAFPAAFEPVGGLGASSTRLAGLPWPAARAALTVALIRGAAPDLFHLLSLSFPVAGGRPTVYTIHDLPPARFPDEGVLPRWSAQSARAAARIIVPSHFAKREVVELLGADEAKICVIPNGLEHQRFNLDVPVADTATLKGLGIEGDFLIYAGGVSRRKNVPALLQAWQIIAPHHPALTLVLAGPPGLTELAREADAPRVLPLGYASRDLLPGLMRASRALVCPSIYEGFGLPPLEAMAMGVPVIGTQVAGAVPEVLGGAGVLAADGSPEALAHAIESFLADPDEQARLRRAGPQRAREFSWSSNARAVLEIYRELLP